MAEPQLGKRGGEDPLPALAEHQLVFGRHAPLTRHLQVALVRAEDMGFYDLVRDPVGHRQPPAITMVGAVGSGKAAHGPTLPGALSGGHHPASLNRSHRSSRRSGSGRSRLAFGKQRSFCMCSAWMP